MPSVMTRCAASAMDCRPELQKRLMLKPGGGRRQPARSAMARAMLPPVVPSPNVEPMITSSTSAGLEPGALDGVPHRVGAEGGAVGHVECALPALAESGARRGDDDRFGHDDGPLCSLKVLPSSARRASSGAGARRRRPPRRPAAAMRAQGVRDLGEPDLVGVEHRTAAVGGEAVAVQIHDVDVGAALRDALLDDAGALVDERVDAALDDLLVADCARRVSVPRPGTSR